MTFEDLTSVYRTERGSTGLSRVRRDLYQAMRALAAEASKRHERLAAEDPDSIVSDGALERRRNTLDYVKRVTDIRVDKILRACMTAAMGGDDPRDLLTPEELEFFDSTLALTRRMIGIGYGRTRATTLDAVEPVPPKAAGAARPAPEAYVPETLGDMPVFDDDGPPSAAEEMAGEGESPFGKRVTVRILEDLPRFSGPERDYDLSKEDVVRMPAVMAEALVNHGKARIVDVRP